MKYKQFKPNVIYDHFTDHYFHAFRKKRVWKKIQKCFIGILMAAEDLTTSCMEGL